MRDMLRRMAIITLAFWTALALLSVTALLRPAHDLGKLAAPCYRGYMVTLAFAGRLHGWRSYAVVWGPDDFRMAAHVVQWPGGLFGYLVNEPGVCTVAEAVAYGTQKGYDQATGGARLR